MAQYTPISARQGITLFIVIIMCSSISWVLLLLKIKRLL